MYPEYFEKWNLKHLPFKITSGNIKYLGKFNKRYPWTLYWKQLLTEIKDYINEKAYSWIINAPPLIVLACSYFVEINWLWNLNGNTKNIELPKWFWKRPEESHNSASRLTLKYSNNGSVELTKGQSNRSLNRIENLLTETDLHIHR